MATLIIRTNPHGRETIHVHNEREARRILRHRYGVRRLQPSYPTERGIGIPLSAPESDGTTGEEWAEIE